MATRLRTAFTAPASTGSLQNAQLLDRPVSPRTMKPDAALRKLSPARRRRLLLELEQPTFALRTMPAAELDKWTGLIAVGETPWKTASDSMMMRVAIEQLERSGDAGDAVAEFSLTDRRACIKQTLFLDRFNHTQKCAGHRSWRAIDGSRQIQARSSWHRVLLSPKLPLYVL